MPSTSPIPLDNANAMTEWKEILALASDVHSSFVTGARRFFGKITLVSDLLSSTQKSLDSLRKMTDYGMARLAVCGTFSSGKSSFLSSFFSKASIEISDFVDLGGISRKHMFSTIVGKEKHYKTLIPSHPNQTNACPLEIFPSNNDSVNVQFEDGTDFKATAAQAPFEELHRALFSYATTLEGADESRPEHKGKPVRCVQLFLRNVPRNVVFADLPGIGGTGRRFDDRVHQYLTEADGIIFVTSAIKELDDDELELLRAIWQIAERRGIPVVPLMSRIDCCPQWKEVLEKNDNLISEHIPGSSLRFTGVSAHYDLVADHLRRSVNSHPENTRNAVSGAIKEFSDKSNMGNVRRIVRDLIAKSNLSRILRMLESLNRVTQPCLNFSRRTQ
jgi:Dynamin family